MSQGVIVVAGIFPAGSVVTLYKLENEDALIAGADAVEVEKRLVDENDNVGFESLEVNAVHLVAGYIAGFPVIVRARATDVDSPDSTLGQAPITSTEPPIGTQNEPQVEVQPEPPAPVPPADNPEGEPEQLPVGVPESIVLPPADLPAQPDAAPAESAPAAPDEAAAAAPAEGVTDNAPDPAGSTPTDAAPSEAGPSTEAPPEPAAPADSAPAETSSEPAPADAPEASA